MDESETVSVKALERATWMAEILGRSAKAVPQQMTLIDLGEDFIGRRLAIGEQLERSRNGVRVGTLDELLRVAFEAGRRCYW